MEMTNWKTVHKRESWGQRNFGVEIRIATDAPVTEDLNMAMYRIGDQIEDVVMRDILAQDPALVVEKNKERMELQDCFLGADIFVEEIPNGYCSSWCCSQKPWYKVTTNKGIITLGWRKRVISIEWEPRLNSATADELFPEEDVTKIGRLIHAWHYDKAKQYISRILETSTGSHLAALQKP